MVADHGVVSDSQTAVTLQTQTAQVTLQQLQQQHGVATITVGDQGQQVYVITDPAQLEALQVCYKKFYTQ